MFTARPEIVGTSGVVASTDWLASGTGRAVLERGGGDMPLIVRGAGRHAAHRLRPGHHARSGDGRRLRGRTWT
jgi:gamma-glutamyltranspeptidase/glutathione hydrolase